MDAPVERLPAGRRLSRDRLFDYAVYRRRAA